MLRLFTISLIILCTSLLWAQNQTTFVVKKDTAKVDEAITPTFFLTDADDFSEPDFFSDGGLFTKNEMKRAYELYTDFNIRISGFDVIVMRDNERLDSIRNGGAWLNDPVLKRIKKAKPGDQFVFTNISYHPRYARSPWNRSEAVLVFGIKPEEDRK